MLKAIMRAGLAAILLGSTAYAYQPPMLIEAFHDGASGLRTPGWLDAHQSDPAHARALLEADLSKTSGEDADESLESPAAAPLALPEMPTPTQITKDTPITLGLASNGYLINGVQLESNDRIHSRPGRNFGTPELVHAIVQAVDNVHKKFPNTPQLTVGDLSKQGGGYFKPHKSHQSGRDADIAFYTKNSGQTAAMRRANGYSIDAPRSFELIRPWLESGQVEFLFIDYRLQKPLYEYARDKAKIPAETLAQWFQYPRGRKANALVRHLNGHADHLHLRLHAPASTAAGHLYLKKYGNKVLKPQPVHYKVRKGDNLNKIAARHKTSLKDIQRWNRFTQRQAHRLKPGQSIIVGYARPRLPQPR